MTDPISTAIITVAIKESLSMLIKGTISATFKGVASLSDAVKDSFVDKFTNYIERQMEKHFYLNTLVFQNQIPLEELYVPLTIIQASAEIENTEKIEQKISSFCRHIFQNHKRILVTDTAGMGKSTLLKFLLIQCIKSNFAIPIFIELRHLSHSQTILNLIERELNYDKSGDSAEFSSEKIMGLLKKGGFVFFFDGYDEIAFKDRELVTKDVKSFIENYSDNYFAITSRPESGLASFPSFLQFKIKPLKLEESFALIKKYDREGSRATQLIERLKGRELRSVHEFLKNPLLTSLLYRCFEYKQNVPTKKHIFYRQVFDALFDWHDASKDGYNTREKKSKLDLDSFHRVLRVVGFISVINNVIEGDKDKILGWIRDAKAVCVGLSFSESDFLEDLICSVPVFTRDGLFYKWSHKSLAEYFAAQYICTEGKDRQEDVFKHFTETGNLEQFKNTLDQIYDLDAPAFRKHFSLPLAHDFTEYVRTSYKGMDPAIPAEQIDLRKSLAFTGQFFLLRNGLIANTSLNDVVKSIYERGFKGPIGMNAVILGAAAKPKSHLLILKLQNTHAVVASILSCWDSWDHVPIRSWPLFKARHVLRTLFTTDNSLLTS